MLQRDYLLREAEKFARAMGEVLTSLIGARKGGIPHQAFEVADVALAEKTNIQLHEVLTSPPDELLPLLTNTMNLQPVHLEVLSDILIELAESSRKYGARTEQEDPLLLLKKAQIMLEHATFQDSLYSMERADKLSKLNNKLS